MEKGVNDLILREVVYRCLSKIVLPHKILACMG